MKIVWTGTDALMMHDSLKRWKLRKKLFWLSVRLIVRLLDLLYVEKHLTNAPWIKKELEDFGLKKSIEIFMTPLKYNEPFPKREHDTVNVLYYKPPRKYVKFRDWLYGIDLINRLIEEYKGKVNFIEVDQSFDMKDIFPIVDLYIRPNRHDGYSRLIRECDIQGIPYYWSYENPSYTKMKEVLDEVIKNHRTI
jgi:hypothetical protein